MKLTHIEIINGLEKQKEIEAFYQKEGSRIVISHADLFFLAMSGKEIVGAVCFSTEDRIPLLQSMRIAQDHQRQKIGQELLRRFAVYSNDGELANIYCLTHPHLEKFYGEIGFNIIPENEIPAILKQKMAFSDHPAICLRRD